MSGTAILSRLRQIGEAQSIDQAWSLAAEHYASLGFARLLYGFTRFRHIRTIGDPDDALILTTCDDDYAQRYFKGGFYAKAPVFRWAERNSGACTWTWVKEAFEAGRLSPDEVEAVKFNVSMGVLAGISVSFPEASARSKGAIALIAESPRQREALEWVADGKTTQDVALLMGVSAAMVEKHLRLAREALAVETTAQAVAKGAMLNMIFQRPPEPVAQAAR